MSNPYISKKTGNPVVGNAEDLPIIGKTSTGAISKSALPLVASNGELNASTKIEAANLIAQIMQESADGRIVEDKTITAAQKREMHNALYAAYFDTSGADFSIIGEEIANTVRDTASRAGFLRRFLRERDLVAQEVAKIRMRRHQINGYSLGPNSTTVESRHNGRFLFPEEVTMSTKPIINEKDLYSEGMGLLDEKSDEALEMLMVTEDLGMKNLFDSAVAASGASVLFPTFTPAVFTRIKQLVQNTGGIPVEDCWMANSLWTEIHGNVEFNAWFDPITQHELVLTGRVGRLQDTNIHTDAFLESRLRVLNYGEIYFVGRTDFLGEVLTRQQVTSSEVSGNDAGQAWRGWFIREILAIGIANTGGVSYGLKI